MKLTGQVPKAVAMAGCPNGSIPSSSFFGGFLEQ
jgi:hypothetical protein